MNNTKLTCSDIVAILQKVAIDMTEHIGELRDLDAASGDGDLGVTVELSSKAMTTYLNGPDETDTGKMLAKLGMNTNQISPSTFGTLLASAFLSAGKAVQGKPEITTDDLVLMGLGAIDGIKKRGKAEVGDKTMLDSLVPAVKTFKEGIDEKTDICGALKAAVLAAEAGTLATENMRAKFGRAAYRQDGCLGIRDAGAAAMYFLITSFSIHLTARIKENIQ